MTVFRLIPTAARIACGVVTVLAGAYLFIVPEIVLVIGVDPALDRNRPAYLMRMPTLDGLPLHLLGLVVAAAGALVIINAVPLWRFNREATS